MSYPKWLTTARRLIQRLEDRLSRDPAKRALAAAMSVEGQISRAECRQLFELARSVEPGRVIVEIGTYRGRSATALGLGTRSGNRCPVYAIDPHVEFTGVLGGQFGPQDQAALYANLTSAGVGDLVAVISLPSTTVARAWPQTDVGLLWVDGDHRYEGVLADVEAWYVHVGDFGIVAFHDAQTPGVERVIDQILSSRRVTSLGSVESMRWFRKKT